MHLYNNPWMINPVYALQESVFGGMQSKLGPTFNVQDQTKMSENIIKLEIYYDSLDQQSLTESLALSVCRPII